MKSYLLAITLFFSFLLSAHADLIILKNGRTVEGKILKKSNDVVTLKIPGGSIDIETDEITKITKKEITEDKLLSAKEIYLKEQTHIPPNDAAAHFNLAIYCVEKELFDDATYEFNQAVQNDATYKEKATPYLKFISQKHAIELLNKAIEQNNYTDYGFALDTLLELKATYPVFFQTNKLYDFETVIRKNIAAQSLETETDKDSINYNDLHKTETPNFIIFSDTPEISEKVATFVENSRDQVIKKLGFSFLNNWKIKCKLYIYSDYKKFLSQSNAPKWAAGWQKILFKVTKKIINNEIIISTKIADRIIIAQNMDLPRLNDVLLHEMAHLIYLGYIKNHPIPLWFNEGIAVYAQQTSLSPPQDLLKDFKENISYPLEKLFYLDEYPKNQTAFYKQSASIVHFLITQCNAFNFVQLSKEIKDGAGFYDTLFNIYRGYFQNSIELETAWINYLKKQKKDN